MHERAILTVLLTGVLVAYLVTLLNIQSVFIRNYELFTFERRAINVINTLPTALSSSGGFECGEYLCINEPLLEVKGLKVELIDLEDKIIWYYGEAEGSVSMSIPRLINGKIGRVRISA